MNDNKETDKPINIDKKFIIDRLFELPVLIAEANSHIIELQDKLAWEKNNYDQLKNEFMALQTIARLLSLRILLVVPISLLIK